MDTIDMIIRYENGTLDEMTTLELFAVLVRTGQAWTLQGHYGRMATFLLDHGLISAQGEVTDEGRRIVAGDIG